MLTRGGRRLLCGGRVAGPARNDAIGWLESEELYLQRSKKELEHTLAMLRRGNADGPATASDMDDHDDEYRVRQPPEDCAACDRPCRA